MSNLDLTYTGRERKRPPGASELVQRIYGLLLEHPEGMTASEIHGHFREGWLDTDAYRAYERKLIVQVNDTTSTIKTKRQRRVPEYGTPKFEERAQRWWIQTRLHSMKSTGTTRSEGTKKDARWYAGERAPRAIIGCEAAPKGYHLHPINAAQAKALAQATTAAHVRREELKAELLEALKDKRFKGKGRELAQRCYEYLLGQ